MDPTKLANLAAAVVAVVALLWPYLAPLLPKLTGLLKTSPAEPSASPLFAHVIELRHKASECSKDKRATYLEACDTLDAMLGDVA